VVRWALRRSTQLLIAVAALLIGLLILDRWVDEPLRRSIERRSNQKLQGYNLRLGAASWSPWRFTTLALERLVVRQDSHPDPAVLDFPRASCSLEWRALFHGRLVGDCELDQPRLHIDSGQLLAERRDNVALSDRGWQDAIEQIYPLLIDEFRIHDGDVGYVGEDREHPLALDHLEATIANVRNVASPEATYPSTIEATAMVFGQAPARLEGRADFLAKPHAATVGRFSVERLPLDRLQPMTQSYNVSVSRGTLSAHGNLEYTPKVQRVTVEEAVIDGIHIDYVSDPELTRRAVAAVTDAKRNPGTLMEVGKLRLTRSELGFINRDRDPDYRVFVSDTDLTLSQWTNRSGAPPSEFEGRGLFMGSGETVVRGLFRPDLEGPDLDLAVAIRGTRLASMNDLLRAYAKVDVVDGTFSFYSELRIAKGKIDGYVKPLFRDVDVYDPEQDANEGFFHKLWERIAGGLAHLLENRPREEVVTVADLAGDVSDPNASNLQVVLNLVENAFFKAILPGFLDQSGKGAKAGKHDQHSKDEAAAESKKDARKDAKKEAKKDAKRQAQKDAKQEAKQQAGAAA
jgi:hypothetical protein